MVYLLQPKVPAVAVVYATVLSLIYGSIKIKRYSKDQNFGVRKDHRYHYFHDRTFFYHVLAMAFTGIPDMVAAASS